MNGSTVRPNLEETYTDGRLIDGTERRGPVSWATYDTFEA
jgi:hypothetical protein